MTVETIRPISTESYSDWATNGCALGDHHLCVDEGWPSDDDTTHIEGSPGCSIRFGLEDPTFEGICVQARVRVRAYTTTTTGVVTTTTTTLPGEVLTVELYDGAVQLSSQEITTEEEYSFEGYFNYYTDWVDIRDLDLTAIDLADMEVVLRDATGWARNLKVSAVDVELDNTLAIIDVRPDGDATGVAQAVTMEVDFNKPIDISTFTIVVALRAYRTYNNETVASNEIIDGTVTFINSDQTAVFTPDIPLLEQADYDIVLDDGITTADASESIDVLYGWSFQTGIVDEVPDEVSEPQIAPPLKDYPEALEGLSVVSTYPAQYAAQVPLDLAPTGAIKIVFNKDIDSTLTNISYQAINGDDTVVTPNYDFNHVIDINGATVDLTPDDVFLENSLVVVSLSTVTADDESIMQEYTLSFAMVINPAYATVEQIKVILGPFADNVTDIAIAMLIYEYSVEADIITSSLVGNAALIALAKKKWVQCKVAYDLIFATILDSQGKSKRLADMQVDYSGVSPREKEAFFDKLKDCIEKWEEILKTGGVGVRPVMTIKGLYDPDRPEVGRNWTQRPSAGPHANTVVPKVVGRRGVKAGRDPRLYFSKNRQVIYRSSRELE